MDPLLILLDLDNTLVDRDGAFARWAEQFIAEHGGGTDVVDWLLSVDGHGYTHRAVLADGLLERLELTTSRDELVHALLHGYAPSCAATTGSRSVCGRCAPTGTPWSSSPTARSRSRPGSWP